MRLPTERDLMYDVGGRSTIMAIVTLFIVPFCRGAYVIHYWPDSFVYQGGWTAFSMVVFSVGVVATALLVAASIFGAIVMLWACVFVNSYELRIRLARWYGRLR
jgi:hypothetical protein